MRLRAHCKQMIDTTDSQIFQALGTFITSILPGVQVFQGQINRVPSPKGQFVIMNNVSKVRLAYTENSYTDTDDVQTQNVKARMQYTMQVDFYGPGSGNNAQTFVNLINNDYAYYSFPGDIKPLVSGEPMQIPLISGEKQYVERWKVDIKMQYNPVASVTQQFFDKAQATVVPL